MQIDKKLCDIFADQLCRKYSCEIVTKSDPWMKYIARYVELFSNISADEFMQNYTTTIGNKIYMPDENRRDWGFIKLLTHEVQHVADFAKYPQDMLMYCLSKQSRAHLEMRAIVTTFQLKWKFENKMPEPYKYAKRLYNYGLDEEHVKYVDTALTSTMLSIQNGHQTNNVGENAISILQRLFDSRQS